MSSNHQEIEIDGVHYSTENLSGKSAELLRSYQFTSSRVNELQNLNILLQRAKNSYLFGLKEEMIAKKAGLVLGEDT